MAHLPRPRISLVLLRIRPPWPLSRLTPPPPPPPPIGSVLVSSTTLSPHRSTPCPPPPAIPPILAPHPTPLPAPPASPTSSSPLRRLPQTQRPDLVHQPPLLLIHPPLLLRAPLDLLHPRHDPVPALVPRIHLGLFRLALPPAGVQRQEHVQQAEDPRVVPRVPHPLPAAGAREDRGPRRRGRARRGVDAQRLEVEPFLQAGAAEGVQAVEEGEGLVEEVGAYLFDDGGGSV